MKSISECIEELGGYFYLMKKVENNYVVLVNFPKDWKTADSPDGKIRVDAIDSVDSGRRCFYGVLTETTFESIFDFILSTKRKNEEEAEKNVLFNSVVEKLRAEFDAKTLDEVKNLSISFDSCEEKKKKRKYERKKKVEELPLVMDADVTADTSAEMSNMITSDPDAPKVFCY